MEDALVLTDIVVTCEGDWVLILVLMEDALVRAQLWRVAPFSWPSLNPCFNGRCTRTILFFYLLEE